MKGRKKLTGMARIEEIDSLNESISSALLLSLPVGYLLPCCAVVLHGYDHEGSQPCQRLRPLCAAVAGKAHQAGSGRPSPDKTS
jgi:hypothetical protein